ncbi:sulfotransferase [Candidatus Venteria ishoeyi]|uniref:sulfotransferase family protein n=1 Tax=Candidatus Venteria ishoeyi TaxID=1899563 RepID=UPI0025A57D89|nr:sulfotransferase [Candidatus Venteria ishoeyi]MDM8547295.1 sulfotransferase [Candidatus Venteria ishoeyi]
MRWQRTDVSALPPPIIIGALGGSGTRMLVQFLQSAGVWMGTWINPRTEDAMATRHFFQKYFVDTFCLLEQQQKIPAHLLACFQQTIRAHRWHIPQPEQAWGFKNPRSMWLIPFIQQLYPDMKFIHVVRDGRDMALSNNQNLLAKHAGLLLGEAGMKQDMLHQQLLLWDKGNRIARTTGEKLNKGHYLILKYEDLCFQPRETLTTLLQFIGHPVDTTLIEQGCQKLKPSPGIGRWQQQSTVIEAALTASIKETLLDFAYDE